MKLIKTTPVAVAAALALAGSAAAQVPMTPRALGMGGAYVGTARGYEALFVNPANLGLSGPRWSIAFPQIAAGGTLLGPALSDLPDLFDDESDVHQDVLDLIPNSGTEVQYDFRAPLAVLQTGPLAFGVSYGSIGEHTLSRDIVELLVDGYDESRTDYSVGNTSGRNASFWDFAVGYGTTVGPVTVGIAGHYLRGGSLSQARMFEPEIDVDARDITVTYLSVFSPGGSGYSVDLGAALQPSPELTVSAALANAITSFEWDEELRFRDFTLTRQDIEEDTPLDLIERFGNIDEPLDPAAVPVRIYDTAQGLFDEAFLPTIGRIGAEWKPAGGTNVGASYQTNLTEGRLAGRWETMGGVGIQQKIPLITLRAGVASNFDQGTLVSGGLSLGPAHLGLARLNDGTVDAADRSGWVFTFGLGVATKALR